MIAPSPYPHPTAHRLTAGELRRMLDGLADETELCNYEGDVLALLDGEPLEDVSGRVWLPVE